MIYIIGTAWMIVVIWGLNALRKGSKQLKDENNGIYQDEHENRLGDFKIYKPHNYDDYDDQFFESHTL